MYNSVIFLLYRVYEFRYIADDMLAVVKVMGHFKAPGRRSPGLPKTVDSRQARPLMLLSAIAIRCM
jgi:hypothetical protein